MITLKQKQNGFHVIELLLILIIIAAVAGVGFFVFTRSKKPKSNEVVWTYNEQKNEWVTQNGTAPACPEPFKFDYTPIESSKISAVLMPGTYRGFNYKPHGAFGTPDELQGKVEVKMPMDATLVGLTRYYEGDQKDLQYLVTFESDCGIAFRFDHLYKLSPELQALAEQTPEPKMGDTRSSPDDAPLRTKFKAGQVIATEVGLPSMKIYGFDFGVYDYRKRNEISNNQAWAAIHNEHESQDWFGACWFDMLPGTDPELAKQLSLVQRDTRRTVKISSDYCANAPYKTLDINGGQPSDG